MNEPQRCTCAECRELDQLPIALQGCPGGYQLMLFGPPRWIADPARYYPTRNRRPSAA